MAWIRIAGRVVVMALVLFRLPMTSWAQSPGFTAAIYEGSCDDLSGIVAPLTDAVMAAGERRGHENALPAANAFSTIPVSLDTLVATDHAVIVEHLDEDTVAACGEVGGFPSDNGSLIFGLHPEDEASVTGVVYMNPGADPSQTDVSLFFVPSADAIGENQRVDAQSAPALDGSDPLAVIGAADPAAAPEEPAFASGGLGLSIEDWEQRHGPGVDAPGAIGLQYEDGTIDANTNANGRIYWLAYQLPAGISLDDARQLGLQYAPHDAELVTTYVADFGLPVDLYYSASLAARFPDPEDWPEAEPGHFIVIYGQYGPPEGTGDVTDILLALGNNP